MTPVYSEESFSALNEFLENYQASFFNELKEAESEEVFHGVHPELTKAKAKILRVYETRPTTAEEQNWKKAVLVQRESGEELVALSKKLAEDKSLSSSFQRRMMKFYLSMTQQWQDLLKRFGLSKKEKLPA